MEYMEILDRQFPVVGTVRAERFGELPLLDIPQMSDEEWNAMARRNYLQKYEQTHGPQAVFPEDDYRAYCAELRRDAETVMWEDVPVVRCG